MSEFEIARAKRVSLPVPIAIIGPSGSGKTKSALLVARGLAGPDGKIGLIDSENGRALEYDTVAGGWDHLKLRPPFTPDRYISALGAFEDAGGYDVVIVDSLSHVWAGEGGTVDAAESSGIEGWGKWRKPKTDHQRMMNSYFQAPFHVIFCIRTKDAHSQVGKKIEYLGIKPVCEKTLTFEMRVLCFLDFNHAPIIPSEKMDGAKKVAPGLPYLKAPDEIRNKIFVPGQPLSEETGRIIREWSMAALPPDVDALALEREARAIAATGKNLYVEWYGKTTREQRAVLVPLREELKMIAEQADREDEAVRGSVYQLRTSGSFGLGD